MPKKKVLGIMFLITYFQKWKKKKKKKKKTTTTTTIWVFGMSMCFKEKVFVNIIWVHGFQNNYNNVT